MLDEARRSSKMIDKCRLLAKSPASSAGLSTNPVDLIGVRLSTNPPSKSS
ncbi:hypothetical protein C7S14_0973 [Burkholderia cepacia]|nr:hypothetical protein C7S14_0973 [Burkholderia cepacia]